MMRQAYSFFKMLLVLLAFIPGIASAQEYTITGKVTDAGNGETLPGVYVTIKGVQGGTITDMNGHYSIKVPDANATLVFSFLGYGTQEIAVAGNKVIEVALEISLKELQEVVVIGYGTVKKSDATGSVAVVGTDDFNKGALTSPQELIIGKTAGVVVTAPTGQPGASATVRIRGGSSLRASNDPLYVIDGFPIDNASISGMSNPLSTINPNDIESVTVLKDASATAIYGSRASNGVIIITTKKGKEGKPFSVSYTGNVSLGTPVKYMDVLNADEFKAALQQQVDNGKVSDVSLSLLGDANTDWQKEIYQNAFSTDHNLSVSGNVAKMPYRASLGYTNQNGLLKYTNMSRTTLDLSASPSLFDKHLALTANIKGMDIRNDFSNTDAIGSAVEFDPTQPIMNGNTKFGGYTAWTNDANDINADPNNIATHNPVARLKYRDNTSHVYRTIANLQADYSFHFLPELHANMNLGIDYSNSKGHDYTDPLASWSYREPEQNVKDYTQELQTSLFDFYLNYKKAFGSSLLDVTGGYSWQHFYRESNDSNKPWVGETGARTIIHKYDLFLVSFFGRINYSLLDKYLLTVTVRDDGSSRFAPENRWGLFPSAAFAWKINNESFLADVHALSNLKLRLGYGLTGQQNIGSDFNSYYPYMATYTESTPGAYYQFGNTFYPTQRPNRYDPSIKWEETTTANIGLDFGFFNERISGSFDYYKRTTNDLINEIPIAVGTNFSNRLITNVGSLENNGYEVTLNLRPVSTQDISWEISGTYSHNKNEITKLNRVDDPNYPGFETGGISGGVGNNVQINAVGHAANTFLLYRQVYDANGKPIEGLYVDKTGQGGNVTATNANKYYMHKPTADHLIGIASKVAYKNFDLSFSGRLSIGNYVYNNNNSNRALYQQMYNQSGYTSNILSAVNETNFYTAQYWSDIYLENASFFRMDNINLGYHFSRLITDKLSGYLNFTVQNAFVISKYSGIDPEVENGIDNNIFPRPRTFILSLNVNL
jgi:TonB-dependent starch-binding outer membrane protein SusC